MRAPRNKDQVPCSAISVLRFRDGVISLVRCSSGPIISAFLVVLYACKHTSRHTQYAQPMDSGNIRVICITFQWKQNDVQWNLEKMYAVCVCGVFFKWKHVHYMRATLAVNKGVEGTVGKEPANFTNYLVHLSVHCLCFQALARGLCMLQRVCLCMEMLWK